MHQTCAQELSVDHRPFSDPILQDVMPGDQTIDLLRRRNFCKETYKALCTVSDARGWHFRPRQQFLMKEVDDHIVTGLVEFASNSAATWVDVVFEPSGLKPLAFKIIFNMSMEWDLEVRSDHLTKIVVPSAKSAGWPDADLTPEENANKIVSAMDQIAEQLPTQVAYSDFLQGAKYPSSCRAAEIVNLILEGKHQAARELADAILRGEIRRTGEVVEQEILNWLDKMPSGSH
jgi:hypothetical protein